jgi:hypothetical protein
MTRARGVFPQGSTGYQQSFPQFFAQAISLKTLSLARISAELSTG